MISAGTLVVDGRVCRPGWLQTSGRQILDCGAGTPPRTADVDLPDSVVVPGFIDMHVHGGGGASYTSADGPEIARAAEFHRSHGTTSTLASLVTAAHAELLAGVRAVAEATRRGIVAGMHLEGPWLSPARCGAHDHTLMRDPDPAEIDAVLADGGDAIRMVTLAPERSGSEWAIRRFLDAGVVVAVGHTDATYEQVSHAVELGATVGTHLFNAMPPLHHREPGPALALLQDPRVTVELIADGVHVHPAVVRAVIEAAGPDRVALGHRCDRRGRLWRWSFSARYGADRRRVRGGAGARNVDDRRQHRDHGSTLPDSGRTRLGCGARRRGSDDLGDPRPSARARRRGPPATRL